MSGAGSSSSPPAFTRRWLMLLLPSGVVGEAIRGDLDEEFQERAQATGVRPANVWYRRQARRVFVDYLLRHRVRHSATRTDSSALATAPRRRRGLALEQLATDTKLAFRAFRREPGLFSTVIVILALGIGANTAVYSVVRAVLLEPLPYPEPERVVHIRQTLASWRDHSNPILAGMADDFPVEWGVLLDWERLNHSFDSLGLYRGATFVVAGASGPDWIKATQTSAGVFAALGVQPALGRLFTSDDDVVGGERTIIVSDSFWRNTLGADPDVVGSTVALSDAPHRIIGVMPEGFYFPTRKTALWTRLADRDLRVYEGGQSMFGLGRMQAGTTLAAARRDMSLVASRINEERPDRDAGYGVRLWRQHDRLIGDVRPVMTLLLVAVATVLLIACINASGLMLVRANRRHRELALRISLGAGKPRIFAQLLTESVLLAAVAGCAALIVTAVTQGTLVAMLPAGTPSIDGIRFDRNVLLFSIAAALCSGVLIGLLPALRVSRADPASVLRGGGRSLTAGSGMLRTQRLLVVAELALAVPLVVGAGLLVGTLTRLTAVDLGFDPDRVLAVRVGLVGDRYDTAAETALFHDTLQRRLLGLPGVGSVAGGDQPFSEGGSGNTLRLGEGEEAIETNVKWAHVEGDYFALFDIPTRAGRTFSTAEVDEAAGVAVINEAMARQFWPDSDPIGEEIYEGGGGDGIARIVIGVVGDVKRGRPDADATALVYLPWKSTTTAFVKAEANAEMIRPALERLVREMDPDVPVSITSMVDRVTAATVDSRFRALLIGLFAVLAAALALVGVGGILTYTVAQQRREIGLRMALGATRERVMRTVLGTGLRLVTTGLLIGGTLAALAVRLVQSFLFETSTGDPVTLIGTVVLLVGAGLAVSLIPARRAARVHPGAVLNAE